MLRVALDARGLITSIRDLVADREVLAPGTVGNLVQLHVDVPNQWDAWDMDPFYRNNVRDLVEADEVVAVDEGRGRGRPGRRAFGESTLTQVLRLRAGERRLDVSTEVDWQETEKFLKVAFPVDVHADRSTSEIQFGHLHRPTHVNTSWDAAKFEICAHRWVHVAEPGYGVAVVNDSTYGHDISRTARPEGGTTTTVRLALLRAPRFPDPHDRPGSPQAELLLRARRRHRPTPSRGLRHQPAFAPSSPVLPRFAAPVVTVDGRRRRSRPSRPPTTAPATSSSASTSPWAAGPGPCFAPASPFPASRSWTSWSAPSARTSLSRLTAPCTSASAPFRSRPSA